MLSKKPFLWKNLKTVKNRIIYMIIYITLLAGTLEYYNSNKLFYLMLVTFMSEFGLTIYNDAGNKLEMMFTLPFKISQLICKRVQAVIIKSYCMAVIIYVLYICRTFIVGDVLIFHWKYGIEILIFGYCLYQLGLVLASLVWFIGKKYKQIIIIIQITICSMLVFSYILISSIYWIVLIIILTIVFKVLFIKLGKGLFNEDIIMKGMY